MPPFLPNPDRGRGDGPGERAWDAYESGSYHLPSDDLRLPLRWDVAARWGDYFEALIRGIADAPSTPLWYEGDPLTQLCGTTATGAAIAGYGIDVDFRLRAVPDAWPVSAASAPRRPAR